MKMYVECCKSKDKDNCYQVLSIDLGYRKVKLFEIGKDVISEICDCKISDIFKMKEGEQVQIAELIPKTNAFNKDK